jgi:hypothetical protein
MLKTTITPGKLQLNTRRTREKNIIYRILKVTRIYDFKGAINSSATQEVKVILSANSI